MIKCESNCHNYIYLPFVFLLPRNENWRLEDLRSVNILNPTVYLSLIISKITYGIILLKVIAQQDNCSFFFCITAHLKIFYLIPSCVRDLVVFLFLLKYIALLVLKEMNCFGTGLMRLRSFLRSSFIRNKKQILATMFMMTKF